MAQSRRSETSNGPATSGCATAPPHAFRNSYAALPERFFAHQAPVPVPDPRLIRFNWDLAAELGLGGLPQDPAALAEMFSGNRLPPGTQPIAMAYAGHQFGQFVPQLGDGRAILLGELIDREGRRRDIQLKGSGRTPYSRNGDGRAVAGPVLREYLVSEAMHALGIPATRALAAVSTGELVFRDAALPGAILTRVAASHVRVGTFQYFAARADLEGVRLLADYVIERHYADAKSQDDRYLALLRSVCERQAQLVASWMGVGFVHGVMNTDNMAISGETIDFGPCAFLDGYDPAAVFSSIDGMGRYAYSNQPAAAQWNLARFAETLVPLMDEDADRAIAAATEILVGFKERVEDRWLAAMRAKIGLRTSESGDAALIRDWLDLLQRNECDFTVSFRALCTAAQTMDAAQSEAAVRSACRARAGEGDAWAAAWRARAAREREGPTERAQAMRRVNPAFIPRNHRIEQMIGAAVEHGDFAPFEEMLQVLSRPFEEQERFERYALPPEPAERVLRTFCGT